MFVLAKKGGDASLFERFMIIIFGASMVLLGAYPLSREHGGVTNYVSAKLKQISEYVESASSDSGTSSSVSSFRGKSNKSSSTTSSSKIANNSSSVNSSSVERQQQNRQSQRARLADPSTNQKNSNNLPPANEKPLDDLSNNDRKELDSLIDSVLN